MKLHIFILTVLSLGLLLTAVVKNYYYVKFFVIKGNQNLTTFELLLAVVSGSRPISIVWIFPFSITDAATNTKTNYHKSKFNLISKYFRIFWAALIIYCLLYAVANK